MKTHNISSVTAIFILFSLVVAGNAEALKTCAVVPFGSAGNKDAAEITAMRNSYEQMVNSSGKYRTVDNTVNKLIKFNYFSKKYSSVTSAAMNAGIILSADYVIYGQVTKSRTSYTLTTTLVDIHKSKAVRSIRSKVDGDINDFIETAPASNVNALLKIKAKEVVKPAVAVTASAAATIPTPSKKVDTFKKQQPKPTQKKKTSPKSSFDWAETFSWADRSLIFQDFQSLMHQS